MSAPDAWRYSVSRDALLTVEEAATCLRVRRAVGVAWLRSRGLIRDVPGLRELVRWGRVLEAIDATGAPEDAPVSSPLHDLPTAGTLERRRR